MTKRLHCLALSILLLLPLQVSHAQDLYQEALEYQQNNESSAAIIQLKNLLSEQPDHGKGRLLLGTLYLNNGQFSSAEKELKRAQELNVESPRLPLLLIRSRLSQARSQKSYQRLLQQLQGLSLTAPELVTEQLLLSGHLHLALRQFDQAEAAYQQVESAAPSSEANLSLARLALLKQQPDAAIKRAEGEIANPAYATQAYMVQGRAYLLQRDAPAALAAFSEAIALQPGHPSAMLGKTRALLLTGNLKEARNSVDQLLELVPNYPDALQISARLYLNDKQPQQAKEILDQLSQRFPQHPEITFLTGYTNLLLGNTGQAEKLLSRNLSNYPQHRRTRMALARHYANTGELEQAQKILQPLLDEDTVAVEVLSLSGAINLKLGDAETATKQFRQAVADNDQSPLARPLAISELLSGDTDAGISRLESLATENSSLQTDMLLLRTYIKEGTPEKARALLKQRITDTEDTVGYLLLAAMVEVQLEQLPAAEQHLKAALEIDPASVSTMLGMAFLENQKNDPATANDWYDKAITTAPGDIRPVRGKVKDALSSGKKEQAEQLAADFYNNHKEQLNAAKLYLSVLQSLQRTDQLKELLGTVIKTYPDEPSFKLQQANTHFAKNNFDAASRALTRLLVQHPDYVPAQLAQAKLLLSQRRPRDVLALVDGLPKQDQLHPQLMLFRGDAYLAMDNAEQAVEQYLAAYEIRPDSEASVRLGRTYLKTAGIDEAITFLQQHVIQQTRDTPAYSLLAGMQLQNGNKQRAIKVYEKITQLQPNHAVAWNNLAWLYQGQNDELALQAAEQAHKLAPKAPAITDTLGWILLNKDPQRALTLLAEAAQQLPNDASVQYHYAKALAKNSRQQEAIKILNDLKQTDFAEKDEALTLLSALDN
ncbi:MAG: tetratricopeptide repeat protein [Motiliproteus sp.]